MGLRFGFGLGLAHPAASAAASSGPAATSSAAASREVRHAFIAREKQPGSSPASPHTTQKCRGGRRGGRVVIDR